jgi:Intra-flagellar transport protein 57
MRKLNVNMDVIASKIKQGWGEHVCEILLGLCDATLSNKRITLRQPQFPKADDGGRMERDIGDDDDDSVEYEGGGFADDDGEEIGVVGE